MSKEIWVPTSEIKVKIDEYGNLRAFQEFTMKPKPIKPKLTGFDK